MINPPTPLFGTLLPFNGELSDPLKSEYFNTSLCFSLMFQFIFPKSLRFLVTKLGRLSYTPASYPYFDFNTSLNLSKESFGAAEAVPEALEPVGTKTFELGTAEFSHSAFTKKNNLFLIIGPTRVAPYTLFFCVGAVTSTFPARVPLKLWSR